MRKLKGTCFYWHAARWVARGRDIYAISTFIYVYIYTFRTATGEDNVWKYERECEKWWLNKVCMKWCSRWRGACVENLGEVCDFCHEVRPLSTWGDIVGWSRILVCDFDFAGIILNSIYLYSLSALCCFVIYLLYPPKAGIQAYLGQSFWYLCL